MDRKVCIKKVEGRATIALHDAETGECFSDQYSVEIFNDEDQIPTVVVTFKFFGDFLQASPAGKTIADVSIDRVLKRD